jgi:hypothetical protein
MTTEFNLSEARKQLREIVLINDDKVLQGYCLALLKQIKEQDKEFIRLLKNEMGNEHRGLRNRDLQIFYKVIDKLAGEKLTK